MRRRGLDPVELLARLFAPTEAEDIAEDGEDDGGAGGGPEPLELPAGDPRLGLRVLARLIADEQRRGGSPEGLAARVPTAAGGAPRRRRKEAIRAVLGGEVARVWEG